MLSSPTPSAHSACAGPWCKHPSRAPLPLPMPSTHPLGPQAPREGARAGLQAAPLTSAPLRPPRQPLPRTLGVHPEALASAGHRGLIFTDTYGVLPLGHRAWRSGLLQLQDGGGTTERVCGWGP